MSTAISIVTPAFRAERTLGRAVRSVLAQTHQDWEMIVVADDDTDYEAALGRAGIADSRLKFLSTGVVGGGSPPARNLGIEAAANRYLAILDADDLMHAEKLTRALAGLGDHGIVSTGLLVTDPELNPLREVGTGADRILGAGDYKFTNLSMDSMLVYDRLKADPRFDPGFAHLSDIDFLLKLFAGNSACYHLGAPLHTYVKEPDSVSNQPGASQRLIAAKIKLLGLIGSGHYSLRDAAGIAGMTRFWQLSLAAENDYAARLAENPNLLFEDHLEPVLKSALGG